MTLLQPIAQSSTLAVLTRKESATNMPNNVIFPPIGQHFFPTRFPESALGSALEETLRRIFNQYADAWYADTAGLSSVSKKKAHPAYGAMIHLGRGIVKFMLEDFERRSPSPAWFFALKELTGTDPVDAADRGNVPAMKQAWIKWGRSNKYL